MTREWGDGVYTFRFANREWDKIDERFGVGPFELARRFAHGTWTRLLLSETFRYGLIGGKSVVTPNGAVDDRRINQLVDEYVDNRPLLRSALFIGEVLNTVLMPPEDDPIPKSEAVKDMAQSSQTVGSPSPLSTDGLESSDTQSKKSKTSRSGKPKRLSPATSPRKGRKRSPSLPPEMNTTT